TNLDPRAFQLFRMTPDQRATYFNSVGSEADKTALKQAYIYAQTHGLFPGAGNAGPDYSQAFDDAGREWNVDPRLLRSVMGQESGGNAGAVSPKGASGLMQVMPPTGVDLGVTNLKDPYQSIFAGAKY